MRGLFIAWPTRRCVPGSPILARKVSRASSRRPRPLARCRKPKSKSGGRSSRPPTSKRNEGHTVREQPNPSFRGEVRATIKDSTPWWPPQIKAPVGAPNVLVVLFDDVGFSDFGCYGSPIKTPTIDGLAGQGLGYTGVHTTPLGPPTPA